TCLLFPAARFGWAACRVVSAGASVLAVWLAFDVGRRLGLRLAAWVPLLCFVQPIFVMASYTTLTETALALYLTAAIWCLVRGRCVWSAVVISLCFVTRYESLIFVPLWVAALRRPHPRWVCYPLLLWAPILHNVLGIAVLERWPVAFILEAPHPALYGQGTPLTMLVKSMATSGPAVAVLALAGLTVRLPGRGSWLIQGCYGTYLVVHALIYWLGAYASGGYPRFLVSMSPLAALCAANALGTLVDGPPRLRRRVLATVGLVSVVLCLGLELEVHIVDEAWLFLIEKVRWAVRLMTVVVLLVVCWMWPRRSRVAAATLATVALTSAALPLAYLVKPHGLTDQARQLEAAVDWLGQSEYADAPVIATNIWASYFLDRGHNIVPSDSRRILAAAVRGTVFIWDARYSPTPRFGITLRSMADRRDWHQVWPSGAAYGPDQLVRIYLRN
ncbi:MAG: hypothetical protein ACYSUQ_02525, partial [Planctomycetota bacterium]